MSVITEASRHHLVSSLEEAIGQEAAMTLAAHLPPVGWADVATKHDLAAMEERLTLRSDARFDVVEERFTRIEERFTRIDERFTRIDERFTRVDERFTRIDERFTRVDERFDQIDQRFTGVDARLDRIDLSLQDGMKANAVALQQAMEANSIALQQAVEANRFSSQEAAKATDERFLRLEQQIKISAAEVRTSVAQTVTLHLQWMIGGMAATVLAIGGAVLAAALA
jgi:chromosome segregation ATPase